MTIDSDIVSLLSEREMSLGNLAMALRNRGHMFKRVELLSHLSILIRNNHVRSHHEVIIFNGRNARRTTYRVTGACLPLGKESYEVRVRIADLPLPPIRRFTSCYPNIQNIPRSFTMLNKGCIFSVTPESDNQLATDIKFYRATVVTTEAVWATSMEDKTKKVKFTRKGPLFEVVTEQQYAEIMGLPIPETEYTVNLIVKVMARDYTQAKELLVDHCTIKDQMSVIDENDED